MSDSISRAIARYAVEDFPRVDAATRNEARRRVLDSVGVAMAALEHPGRVRVREADGRCDRLRRVGTHLRVPAEVATFVNGVSIRCLDSTMPTSDAIAPQ